KFSHSISPSLFRPYYSNHQFSIYTCLSCETTPATINRNQLLKYFVTNFKLTMYHSLVYRTYSFHSTLVRCESLSSIYGISLLRTFYFLKNLLGIVKNVKPLSPQSKWIGSNSVIFLK